MNEKSLMDIPCRTFNDFSFVYNHLRIIFFDSTSIDVCSVNQNILIIYNILTSLNFIRTFVFLQEHSSNDLYLYSIIAVNIWISSHLLCFLFSSLNIVFEIKSMEIAISFDYLILKTLGID